VTKTHNRPRVSNDNPFSESEFRTMKFRPGYPGRVSNSVWCATMRCLFEWRWKTFVSLPS
jgi:hypothetical protein